MGYFPRRTEPYQRRVSERDWDHHGPSAFRKLAFSLLDMALLTGVTLRLGRAALLASAGEGSSEMFVTSLLAGTLFLFLMATLHLGNFPIRHWVWRAPAFGLAVGAVESGASLVLISVGREPYGSGQAGFADWLSMALAIVPSRFILIVGFSIALAFVVQGVRVATLSSEERL
ncbi:MAG TPA: hypothetical protein VMM17_08610 [Gemmatimonadaceae bacterium]|nr:hypothetical protein [Gemmatimonadaceae bacterium]